MSLDMRKVARTVSGALYAGTIASAAAAGYLEDQSLYMGTALCGAASAFDLWCRYFQNTHTILKNFGAIGAMRYALESIGPELRQYLVASDTEEEPFSRRARSLVYRLAKGEGANAAFGSVGSEGKPKIRHSMIPEYKEHVRPFTLTFGEERECENSYTITSPILVSAMSYGSLGKRAIEALSHGAYKAGIPLNTGEGGLSPYHLLGGCDLIFQIGTGKFGVQNPDGTLNEEKLSTIAENDLVKMIEIKFSQGAKPGKGGMLPAEKVTQEIATIRGVQAGEDVISPPRHKECDSLENTVRFIEKVQNTTQLPVGIKLCVGREDEFTDFIREMKTQDIFPDYIALDGAEGGTGAAPQTFLDDVGVPIFPALEFVQDLLVKEEVRDRMKLLAAGKLIDPGRQFKAMAHGADAVYTARGFMLSLGCIQALECHSGMCPAGITTHDPKLQHGLVVREKAERVANYAHFSLKNLTDLLAATGHTSFSTLSRMDVYTPSS